MSHSRVVLLLLAATALTCHRPSRAPDIPIMFPAFSSVRRFDVVQLRGLAPDPDGDSISWRLTWGDGETSGWSGLVAADETLHAGHTFLDLGTFYVSAQARDKHGMMSAWSGPVQVNVVDPPNRSPETRDLRASPDTAHPLEVIAVSCIVTDPESSDVSVRFDWGDGDTSSWTGWDSSGSRHCVERRFRNPTVCLVRVQSRDWSGTCSGWSAPCIVNVVPGTLPGEVRWSYAISGWVNGGPSLGPDGTIYATSLDNRVCAFRPDGTLKWEFTDAIDPCSNPALADDGSVVFWTYDGRTLVALDSAGALKWQIPFPYAGSRNSPAIAADGTIYGGRGRGKFSAFYPDGTERWTYPLDSRSWSSPTIGADGAVYVNSDQGLLALNPDGTLRWSNPRVREWFVDAVIDADGTIYSQLESDSICAVGADGAIRWTFPVDPFLWGLAIGPDHTLLATFRDGALFALSTDGALKWRCSLGSWLWTTPTLAADGTIYIGAEDGLHALDADGTALWTCPISYTHTGPTIGPDGTVYVLTYFGLSAVVGTAPLADTPWPMHRHDPRRTGRVDAQGNR